MHDTLENAEKTAVSRLDPAAVCSLSPEGLGQRIAWIRDEILPHARRTERRESGLAWELEAVPGLAEKLDHLIALERECCAGIVFARAEASEPGGLRLEVRGIDPDAAVFRALQVQRPENSTVAWGRLAKAGGLGALLSFLVCCVLPLVAALIVGSAAAAPLAALDRPWVIGLGSVPGAVAAWLWLRRRSSDRAPGHRTTGACGPGC
jgi:hypothetical protein